MAAKRKVNDLKAKEAKQKKILIGGVVLLAILMFVQMPKLMHRGGNAAAAPPIPAATPTPGAAPTGATTLAPPTVAGAVPTAATPTDGSALADTDVTPTAATGQLVQFDLFESKDPFVQQVKSVSAVGSSGGAPPVASPSAPAAPAASDATPTGGGTGFAPDSGSTAPRTPSVPMTTVAKLTVNGAAETVLLKGSFPSVDPMFELEALSRGTAAISVLGGQYQDGAPTLKLLKRRGVTLKNTADGTQYRIVFVGMTKVPTSTLPAPAADPAAIAAPTAAAAPAAATAPAAPTAVTP
jgi:hypothetical protein